MNLVLKKIKYQKHFEMNQNSTLTKINSLMKNIPVFPQVNLYNFMKTFQIS